MYFWRFFYFLPTLDGSISMTTESISKSVGIFNMYSLRAADCAMFCRRAKKTDISFIPVENSLAGRVADIHNLLPKTKLVITGEFFLKIDQYLFLCLNL